MLSSSPNSPDQRLLALVHRTSAAGRALRRLLADEGLAVGLSDADLLVVWLCHDGQEVGRAQVELAQEVGVSPAQMSATVERLRQRGLIEVERSTLDRRRQVWRTTEAGREILAALQPALGQIAAQIDAQIAPTEQQAIGHVSARLASIVVNLSPADPARQEPRPPIQGAAA